LFSLLILCGRGLYRCVGKFPDQPTNRITILFAPADEKSVEQSLPRCCYGLHYLLALLGDGGRTDALVATAFKAHHEALTFKLSNLAANGRVIPSRLISQLHHGERALSAKPDKEREKRPVQRNAGFPKNEIVPLWAVQEADQVDQRAGQNLVFVCMMHSLP
jgi:hypothetical protein